MNDAPENFEDAAGAVEKLSLWGYFVKCLKNYAVFSGRARRREFWGFYLFYSAGAALAVFPQLIVVIVAGQATDAEFLRLFPLLYGSSLPLPWIYLWVPVTFPGGIAGLATLYWLTFLLPMIAVSVRRLHDAGKNGAGVLLMFTQLAVLAITVLALIILNPQDDDTGYIFIALPLAILAAPATLVPTLVWLCLDSQPQANRYGPNPKGAAGTSEAGIPPAA